MLFTFKEINELAPNSVKGFTVKHLSGLRLSIEPMKNQTINSLAENVVNCFNLNPDLMSIEFFYNGINFNVPKTESPAEIVKSVCRWLENPPR